MDLNSEGSNPSSPSIYHSPYSYLIAHVNLAFKNDRRIHRLLCTKRVLKLLKVLRRVGCLTYLLLHSKNKSHKYLLFTPYYYRQTTFFRGIRLVSTISKKFTVTFKALVILNKSIKNSLLLLETSRGIITHREALRFRIGGLILCIIS